MYHCLQAVVISAAQRHSSCRPVEDAVEDKPLDEGPKKEKKAKKDKKEKKDKKAKKAKKKARAEAKQGSSGDSSSGDEAAR